MMATTIRTLVMATAALVSVLAFAPAAWAGCGDNALKLKRHTSFTSDSQDGGTLIPVNLGQPIVGMWNVILGTPASPFDTGYQVWHDDGTEIMNSVGHSPASGNFCMGVWVQTGHSFRLNHFALAYDPVSGTLQHRINVKEEVVVDASGNNFSGTFTATLYDQNGMNGMAIGAGPIVGRRITVN